MARLHPLAWLAVAAGAVHFGMIATLWKVESLSYLAIMVLLLVARAIRQGRQRLQAA